MDTCSQTPPVAIRDQFWTTAGHIPESAAELARQQETFRSWRADPDFDVYWPIIDRLLNIGFPATQRWAAAAHAAQELRESGYDFDAWRQQREHDRKHTDDHLQ